MSLSFSRRTMEEMLGSLDLTLSDGKSIRAGDGWRHRLHNGCAFRHDYDADVARATRRAEQGATVVERMEAREEIVRLEIERAQMDQARRERIEPAQRLGTLLVDQLTAPVKFTQATRELIKEGVGTFVEVGPGNVLSGLVKRIDRSVKAVSVNNLAALQKLGETLDAA